VYLSKSACQQTRRKHDVFVYLLTIPLRPLVIVYSCLSRMDRHWLKRVLIILALFSPSLGYGQGWINITPPALSSIHHFQSFDFVDGSFEVFVWNNAGEESRGYRMTTDACWDSILVYTSNWCGIGDYEVHYLHRIARSFEDPSRAFSIFVRGGCITECIYSSLFRHNRTDRDGE